LTQNDPPASCPVKRDLKALKAKSASRRAARAQRVIDNAALSGIPGNASKGAIAGEKAAKRSKKKRKKSPSMSKLKKLLWEEMRFVVYAEAENCRACGSGDAPVACHIVPSSESAATKFFLPNIYRGCQSCNDSERRRRGQWVKRHEEIFGADYVNALYEMSKTTFQLKKHWVMSETERMRGLRGKE